MLSRNFATMFDRVMTTGTNEKQNICAEPLGYRVAPTSEVYVLHTLAKISRPL